MTIITSVKVRDGLILGTDSMTQIVATGPGGAPTVLQSYSNARKLFQIRDRPIGVMTYGLGNIATRSIEGLVRDFCRTDGADVDTIEDLARGLFDYVQQQYEPQFQDVQPGDRPLLGFFVAGYASNSPFPEEFEFLLPRDTGPSPARGAREFGASWRGFDAPFTRLYKGFDPYVLPGRLGAKGLSEEDLAEVLAPEGLETAVIFDGMPVQDAVNFAVYLLETTIGWTTFTLGASATGYPLQVATVLPDAGFVWATRPELRVRRVALD